MKYKTCISDTKIKIQQQIEALKAILNDKNDRGNKDIYLDSINILKEALDVINSSNSGRPQKITLKDVQMLKLDNKTQEQVARELNVSLSTVRRYWN